jgi:hypothetical protein
LQIGRRTLSSSELHATKGLYFWPGLYKWCIHRDGLGIKLHCYSSLHYFYSPHWDIFMVRSGCTCKWSSDQNIQSINQYEKYLTQSRFRRWKWAEGSMLWALPKDTQWNCQILVRLQQ